jgi:hypothetical protein
MTTRLVDIVIRQRTSRVRDALFACAIALATFLGATAVGTAAREASTHHLARAEEPRCSITQDSR